MIFLFPPYKDAYFFRLLDNTETVERSGRKLEQGQQLLEESHDVGVTILNDLATQRETLTRARNRVSNNTSSLSYSNCH